MKRETDEERVRRFERRGQDDRRETIRLRLFSVCGIRTPKNKKERYALERKLRKAKARRNG